MTRCASADIAPMCGVSTTLSSSARPLCWPSLECTSSAAPAITPSRRAVCRADSSMTAPREMFTRYAERFMARNSAAPIRPRVRSLSGTATQTKSDSASNVPRSTSSAPRAARSSRRLSMTRSTAVSTRWEKPPAIRAIREPMAPKPTIPSVLPVSSTPSSAGLFQTFARTWRSASAILRVTASRSPTVSSATAVADWPGTLNTTTPARRAASRSMLSVPEPARATTFRFGACSNTVAGSRTPLRTTMTSMSLTSRRSSSAEGRSRTTTSQVRRMRAMASSWIGSTSRTRAGGRPVVRSPGPSVWRTGV